MGKEDRALRGERERPGGVGPTPGEKDEGICLDRVWARAWAAMLKPGKAVAGNLLGLPRICEERGR